MSHRPWPLVNFKTLTLAVFFILVATVNGEGRPMTPCPFCELLEGWQDSGVQLTAHQQGKGRHGVGRGG